ncbi:threonine aspartase 1-like isoform X1 [Osmia bicornis bicornis]|uniref:threonine aspartase 1-like isoform X1 n=2 Tax=Osmia bicornis bicornis TaxID=1437191 RepID=UPI0010F86E89|nr:threonine aspartase 1-like isoform X1 [Osmia bicornis bicornis]
MSNVNQGFIAVHVGAGRHSETLKEQYQKLCRQACKAGIENLKSTGSSLDAVVETVIMLENSPLTNAGFGSNLTLEGSVECDASVMDGTTLQFGAIGAVSGIKNPVLLAKRLCEYQSIKIAYGRIPPSFLVGNGAHIWAQEMGIQTVPPEQLISTKAQKMYKYYKRKIENSNVEICKYANKRMDTVGAICVDKEGNIAAACSSGGIILKYPGRVGQAGMWGGGIWAYKDKYSIGTSTSGCGEHLIRTSLARTAAEAISDNSCPILGLHQAMKADFIGSKFLCGLDQKLGGVIAVRYTVEEGLGDFLWSYSTNSMIIGYMNSCEQTATSHMAVLSSDEVGKKAVVEGICFKIR